LGQFLNSIFLLFTEFTVLITHHFELRPSAGKAEPIRVLRILGRNGCLKAVDELAQATESVLHGVTPNADAYPGSGQDIRMLVWNRMQQSLDEQVVDIDPDVMMVEGRFDRSLDG
jgi:hypothetical protein